VGTVLVAEAYLAVNPEANPEAYQVAYREGIGNLEVVASETEGDRSRRALEVVEEAEVTRHSR
jgi:hypothetical protein